MKINAKLELGRGKYEFEIEERDDMEALHKAAVLCNPRRKCNCCDNIEQGRFKLDSNKDKEGNVYVNVVCGGCGAKSKLGQYKTGGYFWREFEKYEGGQSVDAPRTTGKADPGDMPF